MVMATTVAVLGIASIYMAGNARSVGGRALTVKQAALTDKGPFSL